MKWEGRGGQERKEKRKQCSKPEPSKKRDFSLLCFSNLCMHLYLCVRHWKERNGKEIEIGGGGGSRERERAIMCGGGETKRTVEQEGRDQCRLPGQPRHLIFIHPGPYFSVLPRSRERTGTKCPLGYLDWFPKVISCPDWNLNGGTQDVNLIQLNFPI